MECSLNICDRPLAIMVDVEDLYVSSRFKIQTYGPYGCIIVIALKTWRNTK